MARWRENFKGTAFTVAIPREMESLFGGEAGVVIRRLTVEEWCKLDALDDKSTYAANQLVCKLAVLDDPANLLVELPGFVPVVANQILRVSGFVADPLVERLPPA